MIQKIVINDKDKEKYFEHIAVMIDYKNGIGVYLPVKVMGLAIFCFVSGLLFTALVVSVSILVSWWWAFSGIILPLFYVAGIFIIINKRKTRDKIFSFLDDAKEYTAQAVTESSSREWDMITPIPLKTITRKTIQIEFEFNGEKISKMATGEQSLYTRYIGRYADREIRILYSPQYEFILILKDNAPKFIN